MLLTSIILAGLAALVASQKQDPYCAAKTCPAETTCRVVKSCTTPQSCRLEAQCLANPPRFSHTGVCLNGDPILVRRNGALDLEDLTCGPSLPCPDGAYCNTELQDTYATCCVSDPSGTVKPGSCPANTYTGDDFCLDTCNNDGDCRMNEKCCANGCNRDCLMPKPVDPCDTKVCAAGQYCQRPGMPACSGPGQCWSVGDCVPCPPVCDNFCQHGNVVDPNGCPTCLCKQPRPPPPPTAGGRSSGQRPTLGWPRGGQQQQQRQQRGYPFIPPWFWALLFS